MSIQVVIPARNEAQRLKATLQMLADANLAPIILADNASADDTARIARHHGARVVHEPRVGKGFAAIAGIRAATARRVFLCDADLDGLTGRSIGVLSELADSSGAPLVRLAIGRTPEDAPVTTLTALPLLRAFGITTVNEPLGGLMLLDRDFALSQHLPGGWGFDVALTLAALANGGLVPELSVEGISHRRKPLQAYRGMSHEVVETILAALGLSDWDHTDCTLCSAPSRAQSQPSITETDRDGQASAPFPLSRKQGVHAASVASRTLDITTERKASAGACAVHNRGVNLEATSD